MIHAHTLCRLTHTPVLKEGRTGSDAILSFQAATDHGYGDKKTTTWLRCTMFGKRAETIAPMLEKGQQVIVHGELFSREYQKKDGGTAISIEIHINQLDLLGGKKSESKPSPAKPTKPESQTEEFDDDIPF